MPAATTHVAFAKDVYRLNTDVQSKVENMPMYLLGSQGPDLLFFSRASILPGSLKKYGIPCGFIQGTREDCGIYAISRLSNLSPDAALRETEAD